jgi:ElaB/YqjD/DUF883 family membrane-anchored ribosome-binding protein
MFATARDKNVPTAEDNMTNEGGRSVHDVKEAIHRLKGDARDAAAAVKDDLEDVARRTGRQVRELADSAGHNVTDVAGTMTAKIRDNPIQSSMIALGLGFVFGVLYRR